MVLSVTRARYSPVHGPPFTARHCVARLMCLCASKASFRLLRPSCCKKQLLFSFPPLISLKPAFKKKKKRKENCPQLQTQGLDFGMEGVKGTKQSLTPGEDKKKQTKKKIQKEARL